MTAIERRLATIDLVVTAIDPVEGADAIERATIRGWHVVVKKGELRPRDRVVYIEIDTFLPLADERFTFLAPRGVRTQNGVEGHVLKTARLRGVYSQGIAFPYGMFPEVAGYAPGDDVTGVLGLTKWDPPLPAELDGVARGLFPTSFFAKTDEERIQNVRGALTAPGSWVATEKLDGTSMSVIVMDGEDHVCGRGVDYLDLPGNRMWDTARTLCLHDLAREAFPGKNVAIQGELVGVGAPKNPLRLNQTLFRVFTVQVGDPGIYAVSLPRQQWPEWALELSVPVHDLPFPTTVEEALAQADKRPSLLAGAQGHIEGLVWRCHDVELLEDGSRASFKVISNSYLTKHDR